MPKPYNIQTDEQFMRLALSLARTAATHDEVPVGAIIIDGQGQLIGTGFNRRESHQTALGHAEMAAITMACKTKQSWRLHDCTLFVTLEPCLMCAGAIYQARMCRVAFGATDPKGGALGSLYDIHTDTRLNHNFEVTPGVLADHSAALLKDFFRARRGG